jgi:hypothetical protein
VPAIFDAIVRSFFFARAQDMSDSDASHQARRQPVTIVIEPTEDKKYRIGTGDLEAIASQLRGKKQFSIFQSVLLPLAITIVTAFMTTLVAQGFQYVSWRNSTALQQAGERVTRATAAYDKAAAAIGRRHYATLLFLSSVHDLMNHKPDIDSHLFQLNLTLNKGRFERYYEIVKDWNENYNQIIAELDFALDGPVGIREPARAAKISQYDCKKSLPDELKRLELNVRSVKLQFAAIHSCFLRSLRSFSTTKDRGVLDKEASMEEAVRTDAQHELSDVLTMASHFRCFALNRIEFLRTDQTRAIYLPTWIAWLGKSREVRQREARQAHFDDSEKYCS